MTKSWQYFKIVFLAATLTNCAGIKPISFINDDMDLRDYQTYKLISIDTEENNYSVDGLVFFTQIEKNIKQQMDERMFTKSSKPDLIVRYDIVSSQRTETSSGYNYYDPYSFYRPSYTVSRQVTEGVLLIEFRDRKKKKLVWQASVDLEYKRPDDTDMVVYAIEKIFSTYPYLAASYEILPSLQEDTEKKKSR